MSQVGKYKISFDKKKVNGDFILGLAEKPTAAKRIAAALDSKAKTVRINVEKSVNSKKELISEVTGYFVKFNGKNIMILSALGHLFTIVQDGVGWQYPVYDFKWVPLSNVGKPDEQSKFKKRIEATIESIRYFSNLATDHIVMTDFDEEGEVIGGLTLSMVSGEQIISTAKRMRFSSFASEEMKKSFKQAFGKNNTGINLGMYNRGLMRHYLDWLWGINLSRALMLSLKNTSGRYHTLSTGRVQGPTLSFVAQREFQRRTHVPIPFFKLEVTIIKKNEEFLLQYSKGVINNKKDANEVKKELKENKGIVKEVTKKKSKIKVPVPYNLSSLQKDAYKYYKINPSRTLQIAEKLYLSASISYPRTSSEQYPTGFDHQANLKSLSRQRQFSAIVKEILTLAKSKPIQGKKKDPAHPCIYPTGISPKSSNEQEKKLYALIIHRYLAGHGKPAESESNRVEIGIGNYDFHLTGSRTVSFGWKSWAGIQGKTIDKELPIFRKGSNVTVTKIKTSNGYSKSLPAFNQASLLRMMETFEIGTKATRSEIIRSIFQRKYLMGDSIRLTPVGEIVNEVLQTYSPQVNSVELSRGMEKMGDLIEKSYNEGDSKFHLQDAITQGTILLHEMLSLLRKNEFEIGSLIDLQLTHLRREEVIVGPCMECKKGTLKIVRSIKSGKRFIGCSTYFVDKSCNVTFPLPQRGRLEQMNKNCKSDDYPQFRVFGGKRPWTLCLHPSCKLRLEYKKKQPKNESVVKK